MSSGDGESTNDPAPGDAYQPKGRAWRRPGAKGAEKKSPYAVDPDRRWPTGAKKGASTSSPPHAGAGSTPSAVTAPRPGISRELAKFAIVIAVVAAVIGIAVSQGKSINSGEAPTLIGTAATSPDLAYSGPPPGAAVKASFDQAYGTFEPVTWSGEGNETVRFPDGVRNGLLLLDSEDSWAPWEAFDEDGKEVDSGSGLGGADSADLLISDDDTLVRELHLETEGPWTLELWPISSLPALPTTGGSNDSHHEQCYLYGGPGGKAEMSYRGDSYVSFEQRTQVRTNRLLSVAGEVEATRPVDPGPSMICIDAYDGTWTFTAP
ncbi:MAG TPA: hypothetical protein PLA46_01310 [Phycicoccus sp.]|nr:hypothetical protein [Phycicoccus sp.]HQY95451.1 hypothetical protein [Phycicoccus sp.]HRA43842.1 hypothetical protein [Phycicoccus sp.]